MMRKNDSRPLMIAVLVALVLVLCSVAGVAVYVGGLFPWQSGRSSTRGGPTTLVSMGELIVNLADENQVRYLKTDLVLEMRGKVGRNEDDEIRTRVRDAIIGVLSSKRFAVLIKPDGKARLKKEIVAVVNERLDRAEAVNVYFNEFAMQ